MLNEPAEVVDRDVFVVHAEDDTPFVKGELLPMLALADDRAILSSELPVPGFVEQVITASVRRSRLTLAVVSPAYLRDRWAGFAELLSRNVSGRGDGGRLVPLLVADCELPAILAQHRVLDCRTPQLREAAGARLRERLGRPEPTSLPIACPYPGMRPFSAATASQFFGRTGEIDDLVARLHAGERDIYVIGPSGSGKSSLIAAGLLPRLADAAAAGSRFAVRTIRPGERPMQRLSMLLDAADLLSSEVPGREPARPAIAAAEPMRARDAAQAAVDRLLARDGCDRLLVFVDQLEELFTHAEADEGRRFVEALRGLRTDRRCHLVTALRADFYGALMSSELWPDIEGRFTRLEVAPLRGDALREAIVAPARRADVYLEGELVERLLGDAAAEPGALPLLQEALVQLWGRRSQQLLRLHSYEALGSHGRSGLAVALARRADAALHDLAPPQQRLARRFFLRLVSFGEGRPDTRRQQPRAALAGSPDQTAEASAVLDRLVDARLLTSDASATGEPLIDLAHEALIAGWPELQRWLATRRNDEQHRRQLEQHAAEWRRRGSGSVGLFDAIELGEAEHWIASESAHELGYDPDLPQFLAASRAAIEAAEAEQERAREAQERERQAAASERMRLRKRLTRFALVALSVFSLVASLLGILAWGQRNKAQQAQHQLGLNEQERARSLLVDSGSATNAIPHLLQAIALGVKGNLLRTLLAEVRHQIWRVAVRHGDAVTVAAFSPDGARIVTASADGTARVWDATIGTPLTPPLKHDKQVSSAAFSPDSARVITASQDGTARVWDAATGAPLTPPLKHDKQVSGAAFSPDGARIVTSSADGTTRIWDATTGTPLTPPLKHDSATSATSATTGTSLDSFPGLKNSVTSVAFSPDRKGIVIARSDGTARIWDATTDALLTPPLQHSKSVTSAAFSPDGARVVTASIDGTARVWDATTGAPLTLPLQHDKSVTSAAFSPDGARVVTASTDGTARVWDAATGVPLFTPLKHDKSVTRAEFSPDGARVVTVSQDGIARIWDAATGVPLSPPLKHDKWVTNAAFSPDGSHIVTASEDGTARVWDAAPDATPGASLGPPLRHHQRVTSAAFSSDGTRVVTASWDHTARVWDAITGAALGPPLRHDQPVTSAAFSPDGTRIVTASNDHTARVWDATTGAPLTPALHHDDSVESVAFSPDGARVITASYDGTARVWDATTGARLDPVLKHDNPVTSAAFSPDGSHIVTASEDTVRVWDAVTGARLAPVLKHDNPVTSAAFSPDGSYIVTASEDGTARVWDAVTGVPLAPVLKHDNPVTSAAFSPDGSRIVTASKDGTARVWSGLETQSLSAWAQQASPCVLPALPTASASMSVACPLHNREATEAEWLDSARSLMAAGDAATFSDASRASRLAYQRASKLLEDHHDRIARIDKLRLEELLQMLALRLAMIDVIEHRLPDARTRLDSDAPASDAVLLKRLAEIAHDQLDNDAIARPLFEQAHQLAPRQTDVLSDLAEVYFATADYSNLASALTQLASLQTTPDQRVALATLDWAAARRTRSPDGPQRQRVAQAYQALADGTQIQWTWAGTKHALLYGHVRYEDAKPIVDVLELLEQPVSDRNRAKLVELLQATNQPSR